MRISSARNSGTAGARLPPPSRYAVRLPAWVLGHARADRNSYPRSLSEPPRLHFEAHCPRVAPEPEGQRDGGLVAPRERKSADACAREANSSQAWVSTRSPGRCGANGAPASGSAVSSLVAVSSERPCQLKHSGAEHLPGFGCAFAIAELTGRAALARDRVRRFGSELVGLRPSLEQCALPQCSVFRLLQHERDLRFRELRRLHGILLVPEPGIINGKFQLKLA